MTRAAARDDRACRARSPARRRLISGAGALIALAGVRGAPAGDAARVLRVAGPWEITGLDPSVGGYHFARMQVAETLVEIDAAGRLAPGLAARWQAGDDARRWRFTLRAGARFHDGTPLDATSALAALERARGRPGPLSVARIESMRIAGDALEIALEQPLAALPALLAHSSTIVLGRAASQPVIGSGPYRITALDAPHRFDVEPSPYWRGPAPRIGHARYLAVPRAETRALLAESGQSELAYGLSPAGAARLRRAGMLDVRTEAIARTLIVKVNAGHRLLADPRVRRALSLAIDRAGIATGLLRTPALAASQLFAPMLAPWHDATLAPLATDTREALALLESLGWRMGRDGLLERADERFTISLRTFPDRPELPVVATALQEQWRRIGIGVKVLIGSSGAVPLAHRDGTLELALAARNYAVAPDPLVAALLDFAPDGGDWGAMNWSDPHATRTLEALRRELAPERRARLCAELARVLHDALPVIPVAWLAQNAAAGGLVDVAIDPFERSYRIASLGWADAPAGARRAG